MSIGLVEYSVSRSKVFLRKKTMDLCVCESEEHEHAVGTVCSGRKNNESEEHGHGESVGWYVVYMRERGGWGRGGCGFRRSISDVIHSDSPRLIYTVFIPLPRFFHSRRVPPLLTPSLVLFSHALPNRYMMWIHFVSL